MPSDLQLLSNANITSALRLLQATDGTQVPSSHLLAVLNIRHPTSNRCSTPRLGRRAVFIAGFACVCWGWGNRPLCAAIAAWGLATAVSRALMGRHYIGDVIAGTALGLVTTALVTQVRRIGVLSLIALHVNVCDGAKAC